MMLKWLWLSVVVLVLDQGTKYLASSLLAYQVPVPVLPFFNLTLMHNPGAAFSFLGDASGWQRWFFIGLALLVCAILLAWLMRLRRRDRWIAVAIALVVGGAMGNVIDRLLQGYVVDFIQLYYRQWYWPTFNIADSAITVGAALLILDSLFLRGSDRTDEEAAGGG